MTKKKTKKSKRKSAPQWASKIFEDFLEEIGLLSQMVHLSSRGISMVRSAPDMVEALIKFKDLENDEGEIKKLERARVEAKLAASEIRQKFPLLHSWAVVSAWALLEALSKNVVALWLKRKPSLRQIEEIQRLKIKLGEYENIPASERYLYIAELLESASSAGVQNGVSRFEALLKPIGLSGEVPKQLKIIVFEFGQVRNLIVHRSGVVDRSFLSSCPWIKVPVGRKFKISPERWHAYLSAIDSYVALLVCRSGEYFGKDMSKNIEDLFESSKNIGKNLK